VRHHIDVGSVLRRSVCDLYSNLVTRPTGEAVRREIEDYLSRIDAPCLMVIDFSQVGLLDFSCADEVIGKLVGGLQRQVPTHETYFLVRGARQDHLEAIEAAIERYDVAVIVEEQDGSTELVGPLDGPHRRAWHAIRRVGRAAAADLAVELDETPDSLATVLDGLWERRLVMRDDTAYMSLQSAT
jgi:hypothetical protein